MTLLTLIQKAEQTRTNQVAMYIFAITTYTHWLMYISIYLHMYTYSIPKLLFTNKTKFISTQHQSLTFQLTSLLHPYSRIHSLNGTSGHILKFGSCQADQILVVLANQMWRPQTISRFKSFSKHQQAIQGSSFPSSTSPTKPQKIYLFNSIYLHISCSEQLN